MVPWTYSVTYLTCGSNVVEIGELSLKERKAPGLFILRLSSIFPSRGELITLFFFKGVVGSMFQLLCLHVYVCVPVSK